MVSVMSLFRSSRPPSALGGGTSAECNERGGVFDDSVKSVIAVTAEDGEKGYFCHPCADIFCKSDG